MNNLIEKLTKIRKELEKKFGNDGFPLYYCYTTSKIVEEQLGFKKVSGFITQTEEHHPCHWWNYDPTTETYIDLTLDQFEYYHYLGPIAIIPKNSELAKKIYEVRDSFRS